ncbi:hypothetical protein WJX74_001258 [Apatococcus lobatus]|uniref:Uncharacterized protein n=1 Tax=Apatococcus lobatus TaxID=904363 RepID=A0AAW1RRS3_9CHLO
MRSKPWRIWQTRDAKILQQNVQHRCTKLSLLLRQLSQSDDPSLFECRSRSDVTSLREDHFQEVFRVAFR